MNIADLVVLVFLVVVVLLIVRFMKKNSSSCHGQCSSCQSGCTTIDWNAVKKDIQKSKSQER